MDHASRRLENQEPGVMPEAAFAPEVKNPSATAAAFVERQLQQYVKDHPLNILSLTGLGREEDRSLTHQEKMLKAYQGRPMEDAIREFPHLYDIYARKAAVYQQATGDFAGLTNEKRLDAIEKVMVQFDANAARTIMENNQMKFPRATYQESNVLNEMKARGETTPLDIYHRAGAPQR
jgi:hypothetical protein